MTPQEARKELARRELARRQSSQTPQPNTAELAQRVKQQRPAVPDRGTPEFDQRRAELLSKQQGFQNDANKAQTTIGALNPILGAANFANRAANSFTLGIPDRLLATGQTAFDAVSGNKREQSRFDELKSIKEGVRQQFPKSSIAADIGGAIGGIGKVAKAGALPSQIAGRLSSKAAPKFAGKGAGLLGSTAGVAVDGAVIAGAEAGLNGRDIGKATVDGGLFGAGINALTRGAGSKLAPLFKGKKPDVPSTRDLLDSASSTRKELKDLGAEFAPNQLKELANGISDDIATSGIDKVGGKVGKAARQIQKNTDSPATFEQLDNLRKQIDLPATASNSDKRLAGILRGHIDDFVGKVDPANGSGEGLTGLLNASRDFTKRGRTAESLEGAIEAAKTRTAKSGTGGNLDNNLRSEVDRVLKKQGKFLDRETKDRLEDISRGSKGQNLARSFGRAFSPTTGALQGAASGAGAIATGGATIPLNIAGILAKKGSERLTQKNIEELIREIQAGSKAAAARPDTKISKALSDRERQQNISRILVAAGISL